MKISSKGLNIIKKFEGCRLTAYRCSAGVLTIGYGHTGSDVKSGMKITGAEATALLKKDVERFERHVEGYMDVYNFNQNQFDALVSFAFNIGNIDQLTANGKRSIKEISAKITAYNKAGGAVLEGLVKRRAEEKKLFDTPVKSSAKVVKKKPANIIEADVVKYKVTASALNCRNKASMNGGIIGIFKKGEKLELITKSSNGWYKVRGKAMSGKTITGYCACKYLKKV